MIDASFSASLVLALNRLQGVACPLLENPDMCQISSSITAHLELRLDLDGIASRVVTRSAWYYPQEIPDLPPPSSCAVC